MMLKISFYSRICARVEFFTKKLYCKVFENLLKLYTKNPYYTIKGVWKIHLDTRSPFFDKK